MVISSNPLADQLIKRREDLKTARSILEADWQVVADLVRDHTADFYGSKLQPTDHRREGQYDSTPVDALEEFAGGLMGFLTNPTDRWFSLTVEEPQDLGYDHEALEWLELVADIIYKEYNKPAALFNSCIHETYLDIGAFGTAILYQDWNFKKQSLRFKAYPLADCILMENADGDVDTLYRSCKLSIRQMIQQFGFDALPDKLKDKADTHPDEMFELLHAVFPREDRDTNKFTRNNKKFASIYIQLDEKHILEEGGFDSFPFHCPRWLKLAGQIYGKGPGVKCLPDIKMLNRMEITLIKAAQKLADPPIQAESEGFMLPIRTSPGSIIFREPGMEPAELLTPKGSVTYPIGEEKAEQKREHIRKCFFNDVIKMEKEKVEMTAFEVADRRDEKLRKMSPMLGRLQSELLDHMIMRSYSLLDLVGRIPPAPPSLQGHRLRVGYESAAARAQTGVKAQAMAQFFQDLIPMAQAKPDVIDAIDDDMWIQELAKARKVPMVVVRSLEEIAAIRQERQQQQQMQQMAEVAGPASQAVKNVAEAQEALGGSALL
jgi:hypothetical protein